LIFFCYYGFNYSAGDDAPDTPLRGCARTLERVGRFAEQGVHISGLTFLRTEMDCQGLHRPHAIPRVCNRNFATRGSQADILCGKAKNPDFIIFL
jgi:hypothetical protein